MSRPGESYPPLAWPITDYQRWESSDDYEILVSVESENDISAEKREFRAVTISLHRTCGEEGIDIEDGIYQEGRGRGMCLDRGVRFSYEPPSDGWVPTCFLGLLPRVVCHRR